MDPPGAHDPRDRSADPLGDLIAAATGRRELDAGIGDGLYAVTNLDSDCADALAARLASATLGALELYAVYLGAELGLYRVLAQYGALTAAELAERVGIAFRCAVEWLEQQAVAGLLDVEHPEAAANGRRYRLAPDHARVLVDPDDPAQVAPFAHMLDELSTAHARPAGAGDPTAGHERDGAVPRGFHAIEQRRRHGVRGLRQAHRGREVGPIPACGRREGHSPQAIAPRDT